MIAAHNPHNFFTKLWPLHVGHRFSCRALPKFDLPPPPSLCLESSRNNFGPSHFLCMFMFMLLLHPIHRYLFAATHHSVRCVFDTPFFDSKYQHSFWFWSKLFTIFFHSSTRRLPSHCLQRWFFETRHLLHFLRVAMCFDVLALHQYAFLVNFAQLLRNKDPQIGVFRSWATALQ